MSSIEILVVEDEALVAEDLRETLELLGYIVPFATISAEEAIAYLDGKAKKQSKLPHLVFMDIQLAGAMDGIEASHRIQTRHRLPVVYLTANADLATLERVKGSQPFGYILKPFNERTLATTIEIALSRHQAEQRIYAALNHAQLSQNHTENLLQQKSDYLYMVAHELRNPLTAIKFATEILEKSKSDLAEDQRERYIHRIHAATKNLSDMLDDVLLLERSINQGLDYLCPTPVHLADFCRGLIESFQLTLGENHLFSLTTTGIEITICLDERMLWHLLSNLVSNAVKYSPNGSTIAIAIDWAEDTVQISVQDQGIGISPEMLPKLFEPFQRGRNVGSIPGTGLGLAIAKRCAEMQGARIAVDSDLNQGTTVRVYFPLSGASASLLPT